MKNQTINIIGWVLFIISAIGFIISSIGSFWAMFGSLFFLVACFVFLIPYFRKEDNYGHLIFLSSLNLYFIIYLKKFLMSHPLQFPTVYGELVQQIQ